MTPEQCKGLMERIREPFELKHTVWLDVAGKRVDTVSREAVTERLDRLFGLGWEFSYKIVSADCVICSLGYTVAQEGAVATFFRDGIYQATGDSPAANELCDRAFMIAALAWGMKPASSQQETQLEPTVIAPEQPKAPEVVPMSANGSELLQRIRTAEAMLVEKKKCLPGFLLAQATAIVNEQIGVGTNLSILTDSQTALVYPQLLVLVRNLNKLKPSF